MFCSPKEERTKDKDNAGNISSLANVCRKAQRELTTPVNQSTVFSKSTMAAAGGCWTPIARPEKKNLSFAHLLERLMLAFPECSRREQVSKLENRTATAVNSLYFTVVLSSKELENLTRKDGKWHYARKRRKVGGGGKKMGKEMREGRKEEGEGGSEREGRKREQCKRRMKEKGPEQEEKQQTGTGRKDRPGRESPLFSDTGCFTGRGRIASQ